MLVGSVVAKFSVLEFEYGEYDDVSIFFSSSSTIMYNIEIGSTYQNLIEIKLCNSFIIPKWANTPPP